MHLVAKRSPPRTFDDLSKRELFNLGYAVKLFSESLQVVRAVDGRVLIFRRCGLPITIEELLDLSKGMPNTL